MEFDGFSVSISSSIVVKDEAVAAGWDTPDDLVFGAAQYNPELSKDLCELTVASYCRPTKLIDWSCTPCKNSNLEISNVSLFINSTQATLGYIAISKKLDAIGNIPP